MTKRDGNNSVFISTPSLMISAQTSIFNLYSSSQFSTLFFEISDRLSDEHQKSEVFLFPADALI